MKENQINVTTKLAVKAVNNLEVMHEIKVNKRPDK
jgi:hypothetical protein